MANSKVLIGGIVVDGLNIKKDLFYYIVPPSLYDEIEVGSRVEIPFGIKDEPHSGIVFSLKEISVSQTKELKSIKKIVGAPIIGKNTIELIRFVSEKYFIPVHILFNKVLGSIFDEKYRKYIICNDPKKLIHETQNSRSIEKHIASFIAIRKILPVSIVRKHFGIAAERYLKKFEEAGFIERKNIIERRSKNYYLLNIKKSNAENAIFSIKDRTLKNAVTQIIARLLNSPSPIRETELKKKIKYGKRAIKFLVDKNIIRRAYETLRFNVESISASFVLIDRMSIKERTVEIIKMLKKSDGKALIIFPEIALINRVKELYKKEFKEDVFVWNGGNKRKLIEAIYFNNKRIILSTFFPLFLEIPDLKYLIIEDASSKYFRQSDFTPFDVEVAAIKKGIIEKLKVVFSTSVPDEYVFMLIESGKIADEIKGKLKNNVKVVDMKEEFKKKNWKMLSLYLQKKIGEDLKNERNVAILLNRKSYSTFVMCRECGYVMRCPKCSVPLYYDKEKNLLVCPICGYTEKPPDICPRCKSPNIKYFSGGIQKLEELIRRYYKEANIVKLTSENGSRSVIQSSNYSKTIFIGTEFLLSHLDLSKVEFFAFISIDIFLNHYSFNASFNTFRVIANASVEMKNKEVVIQTYLPEHFALKFARNLDFMHFFKEEFELRKQLKYPPFMNLLIFSFSGKIKEEVYQYANKFKDYLEEKSKRKNMQILGPSPAPIERRGDTYYFEISIKTEVLCDEIRNVFMNFINKSGKIKISVSSFLSEREYMEAV